MYILILFVCINTVFYFIFFKISNKKNKEINKVVEEEAKGEPLYSEEESITAEQIVELYELAKQNDITFMVKFQECFPLFIKKLNEVADPSLNYAELEICAYTKLSFATKDIAICRKDTVRSVENRKYRIRKKLKISSDVDFVLWITTFK